MEPLLVDSASQRQLKLRRRRPRQSKPSKRFSFSLGRPKENEEVSEGIDAAQTVSAYRLPPPLHAPQPGIRVSSLNEGTEPCSRAGSSSLQRSLSSPASLRSRSLREEQENGLDPATSPDCIVGSSRSHFGLGIATNTPALTIIADYYATTIDEELEPPVLGRTISSSRSSYHSCNDEESEEGATLHQHRATDVERAEGGDDELLLDSFAHFTRADARLSSAVEELSLRQDALNARALGRRPVARRTGSMPNLPRVDLSPTPPPRSAWQAISAIMRPQPDLPMQDEAESPSSDESEEDEPDPRLLIRLAVEDVRAAQSNLLACLSELAVVTGLSEQPSYEQQILVCAQNILSDATFNVEHDELQNLRALAMRACETLERVRELSARLLPAAIRSPSRNRVRVSAITGGRPVAPERGSSLQSVPRAFPHKRTLLLALSAWDIAYRDFARSWRHHQQNVRMARRQARAHLRMTRIVTAAQSHGLQKELAAAEGVGTVVATAQLVASTLERAIQDGLLTRQEAISLEPRVFFALPRLSILYGARDALLPASWESQTPMLGDGKPSRRERPLTLFLPRVCGSLSNEMIRSIRSLSPRRLSLLAGMLSGSSPTTSPRLSSISSSDAEVWELYREIAALADRESIGAQRWGKVLSKCLKAWSAEQISLHSSPRNSLYCSPALAAH